VGPWVVPGTTPANHQFVVSFNAPAITGAVRIIAYMKTGTVTGPAAGLWIYGGDGYSSHMDIDGTTGVLAGDVDAKLTTHTNLTDNPHVVTLQQAANAGGFTKTNQEITIRTLLSSFPPSTRYWGTGVYDGNGYSFSYDGGNPDPSEGYGTGYNWQFGIIPGSGSPHPKIRYDFGTGTQSGYILFPTPDGIEQINTLALLSDVSLVQATAGVVQVNLETHTNRTDNPHAVTAEQVGAVATNDARYMAALTNAAAFDPAGTANSVSNVLASPYQPWTATLTPPANGGTTLVTFANGTLPLLVCAGAQTVGVNPAGGWGAAGVNRFTLGLYIGSFSVTIATNGTPAGCNVRWGNTLTLSTTRTNQLLFRSVGTNDWVVYGSL
jgi:hypothetical protein